MASRIFSPDLFPASAKPSSSHTQRCKSVKRIVRGSTSGCASYRACAIAIESVQCSGAELIRPPSLSLLHLVDRVARNLHHQVRAADDCLTRKTRQGRQTPGLVE